MSTAGQGAGAPPDPAIANPTPMPTNGVGSVVLGALVNDGVSSFTDRAAAFLLPGGLLLGGCLLVIVAGRWRSGH